MPCSRQAAATREIHNYSTRQTPLLHHYYTIIILIILYKHPFESAELWAHRTTELNLQGNITDLTVLMLRRLDFLALEAYTKALRTARTAKL